MIACLLALVLFQACYQLTVGLTGGPLLQWLQFPQVREDVWRATTKDLQCLTGTGSWQLNSSMTIVDNIHLYAPCLVSYPNDNPCNWTLDGNVLKYYWQPEPTCGVELKPFDAGIFCSLMKDKGNMLVVGDSISELSVKSWENKILVGLNASCPHPPVDMPSHTVFPNCGNDFSMLFVRNDYLSMVKEPLMWGKYGFQFPWQDILKNNNISLLVLNRGAHYRDDAPFIREVNETLHFVTTQHPHISVIWRNTPHGDVHFNFHMFSPPLKTAPELDKNVRFHYAQFRHQNTLVEQLLAEHYPRVLYLDVFSSAVLRLDGRHDPLHPCVPGFMDSWLQFIYNALLLLSNHRTSPVVIQEDRKPSNVVQEDRPSMDPVEVIRDPGKTVRDPVRAVAVRDPRKTVSDPVQVVRNPVKGVRDPGKTVRDPVEVIKVPGKAVRYPVQTVRDPVRAVRDPVRDSGQVVRDPVQTVRSTIRDKHKRRERWQSTTGDRQRGGRGEA